MNGFKVVANYEDIEEEICNGEHRKCITVETKRGNFKMVDWDIENIVTTEQFESMKYIVGGKEE